MPSGSFSSLDLSGHERLRVVHADAGEPRPVPMPARVVEAPGRAAIRVVLPVDRLRADEVAVHAVEAELVAGPDERDLPARAHPPEDDEADVARRTAAGDRDRHVGAPVTGEVGAYHPVGLARRDADLPGLEARDLDVRPRKQRPGRGARALGRAGGCSGLRGKGSERRGDEQLHGPSIGPRFGAGPIVTVYAAWSTPLARKTSA